MLDPITALSVAAAVVQFVDFSAGLLSKAHKLHRSSDGSISEISELRRMVAELQRLSSQALAVVSTTRSSAAARHGKKVGIADATTATKLADDCTQLSDSILVALSDFKIRSDPGWFKSLKVAHKIEKHKPKLLELQRELIAIRSRVQSELLCAFSDNQTDLGERLHRLEDRQLKTEEVLTKRLRDLHGHLRIALERKNDDWLGKLTGYIEEARRVASNRRLLSSLRFDKMRAREEAIFQNHQGTFEWIFQPYTRTGVRIWLQDWLQNSGGMFWVSGKAGSGKSTLMKFLTGHQATFTALQQWAGARKLIVASHFFWSAGDDLQNCQLGLLRTLCHDILRACPDLIPIVLGQNWEALEDNGGPWTLRELSEMIDVIRKSPLTAGRQPISFCFFIDGLDEYKGDHGDIITLLQNLSSSRYLKICAASRPWNIFEDALGKQEQLKLLLQDLTQDDIAKFVNDKLVSDQRFIDLASTRAEADEIVAEIQTMAEGVFLWVFLVVRELLKSVVNGDSLADLQRRLRSLPPDLEKYFQHIFDTLDPFYQRQTARAFLICLNAVKTLPALAYCVIDGEDPLTKRLLSSGKLAPGVVEKNQWILAKRINARARDLLEPTIHEQVVYIDFLHRTVRDFLATQDMGPWLTKGSGEDFDLTRSLCLAQSIAISYQMYNREHCQDAVYTLLHYARLLEQNQRITPFDVLDRLEVHLKQRQETLISVQTLVRQMECEACDAFWPLILYHRLEIYTRRRLIQEPSVGHALKDKITFALCLSESAHSYGPEALDVGLIELLLQNGADINLEDTEITSLRPRIWAHWLFALGDSADLMAMDEFYDRALRVTELLLVHGAYIDPVDRRLLAELYGASEAERLLSLLDGESREAMKAHVPGNEGRFSLERILFWR